MESPITQRTLVACTPQLQVLIAYTDGAGVSFGMDYIVGWRLGEEWSCKQQQRPGYQHEEMPDHLSAEPIYIDSVCSNEIARGIVMPCGTVIDPGCGQWDNRAAFEQWARTDGLKEFKESRKRLEASRLRKVAEGAAVKPVA